MVVSAGGGLVGEPLLRAAAEAQPAAGVPMRLIAGPLLPDDAWRRLQRAGRARASSCGARCADLGAELRAARASVSQGGYNTALEVVRSGVPGLIVPYATPEEDEQTRRARRLERLGAVRVLAAGAARALHARRRGAAAAQRSSRAPASVDLDGARRTGRLLDELLAGSTGRGGRAA